NARVAWLGTIGTRGIEGEWLAVTGDSAGHGGVWNARIAPSERDRLREYCGARARPDDVNDLVLRTAAFRRERLANARFVWEVEPELNASERIAVGILQQRVAARVLEEIDDRGLTEALEQHLEQVGYSNAQDAAAVGARLATSGTLRLPPEMRLARFRSLARMTLSMSDAECRRWAGLGSAEQSLYHVTTFDPDQLAEHV